MAYNGYPLNYPQLYSSPLANAQIPQIPQIQQIPQIPQMQQPTQNSNSNYVWVQGEAGAKAYPVAAGNSVLLMDSEKQVFYIKTTDNSGMPQPLRRFVYHEDVNESNASIDTSNFITRDEFEEALAKLGKTKAVKKKEVENNE